MIGTAPPRNLLHRLGDALVAYKAGIAPAALYPVPNTVQTGFLTFPGWDWLERNTAQQQGQDEKNAKTATANPWVFRSISAIAREFSAATLDVKRRAEGGDEDIENHPLEKLWEAPNPFMGRAWMMQWWCWQLLLYGEAYLFVVTEADGTPAELWPLPSLYMTPVPDAQKFISAYAWRKPGAERAIQIDTKPIVYTRLPNPFDIRRGLSPLCALMIEVEGDGAMARWNKNFFAKENATPSGLLAMPKDSLDADVIRVRQEVMEFFGGNGTRRVAVARAGDLAWTPFDRSQKDMEFLQGREFNQKLIDTVFGIPEGFWSKDATRANSEGAKATMIENAVWPHLVMLSEDLNAQLLPAYYEEGLRAEFADIRPRNRALELQELAAYQAFSTVNELRTRVDMDELDDPRGEMFVAEVGKGTPIPATPAGELTEEYLAEQEADAGVGEEEPPDAETLPPEDETPAEEVPPEEATGGPIEALPTKADDLARWERKALKAIRAGRAANVKFASAAIDEAEQERIRAALEGAQDAAAAKAAFAVKDQSASERAMFAKLDQQGKLREKNSKGDRTGPRAGGAAEAHSFNPKHFNDAAQADAWARESFAQWGSGLSQGERQAFVNYQGADFGTINSSLRDGSALESDHAATVKALDAAIAKGRLSEDTVLYRGMDLGNAQAQAIAASWKPGDTFREPGYMSTSVDKSLAHDRFVEGGGPKATIEVRAPKGTNAGYMNVASNDRMMDYEREMLLPRDTNYRIISSTPGPNGPHVVMEVMP